jgi:hypothetical protein
MRQLLMVVVVLSSWSACATDADETDPLTSERQQAISQIIGDKFDNLASGNIDGQAGWVGNCVITDGRSANKYLRCVGNRNATKGVGYHGAGSYTSLVDLGPNINVIDATHGKLAYDGPEGRVFQIIVGCNNIRVAFQMGGPSVTLMTFPCQSETGPPASRVVCNWATGGTVLSCGASRLPEDPTVFIPLGLPSALRPFDRVAISTFDLPGASLFDKVYIWQN